MSTQTTNERKSADQSSSETRHIELYLFACGHGDTLLIRLPDDRWVLVDCFLPKNGGVRQRFFELIHEKRIQHLAAVFQTHPDYDHFLGMHDVLRHFIEEDGKSVGLYLDSGLNAQQIKRLLVQPKRPARDEYCRLQGALREWDQQGKIDWRELDAQRAALSPSGFDGRIHFIPVGPDSKARRRLTEESVERYGKNTRSKLEANELSLVLVLVVNDGKTKLNVLLSADADRESIQHAIGLWRNHANERGVSPLFNAIKVAHHGSIENHVSELCGCGSDDASTRVAAISAGTREALPDRHVLAEYLGTGWTVMVTTVRKVPRPDRVVFLHVKQQDQAASTQNTIELKWNRDGEFFVGPSGAIVESDGLSAYSTAKA